MVVLTQIFLIGFLNPLLFILQSDSSCVQRMDLIPSATYSGKTVVQGVKLSTTVSTQRECISFCVNSGDKTSIIYDFNNLKCSCHNLPLPLLAMSPQPGAVAFGAETVPTDTVVTWIDNIIDRSSYFTSFIKNYYATRMIGPADFYPSYGNTEKAWCPRFRNNDQWVEFAISESIYITEIHIYEVFYAGGVQSVSIRDSNSNWVEVWRTPGLEIIESSRIFSPNIVPPDFKSNAVRIDLDLGTTNVWSEFDAVRVIGTRTRRRTTLE